jgi:hypothetical protein
MTSHSNHLPAVWRLIGLSGLLYRPDWEEARARLVTWWGGGDIGRAAIQLSAPREAPWEKLRELPEPAGWVTDYSTSDLAYHVHVRLRNAASRVYLGEAVPAVNPGDLAPNCLALYLGCRGVESPGTVWCEPFLDEPEPPHFRYDPDNFYWRFTREAIERTLEQARGKVLIQFPDLIEGLDTLAAMRGTDRLLFDLIERPEWVQAGLRQITDRYFHYYDVLYDRIRDEQGGSFFWAWAPGRLAKLQCDFSAMISPAMFREFMVPVLAEMTERVSYSLYHWDGPQALPHLEALLSLPRLNVLQWTPGAGIEPCAHPRWWPVYHQVLDAGKKLNIGVSAEDLPALKREFGEKTKGMLLGVGVKTAAQGEEVLEMMEV